MTFRRLFLFAFAAALLAGLGCSNDSGGGSTAPALVCTDGGNAAANSVNTNCGGALDSVTEQVDIILGGPAAGSTTLRGLNFDVTYDPAKLTFMPAASYTSPLFPSPAALIAVSSPTAGRVIASVQQTGGSPAVAVAPGQHVVLSLTFQSVSGATYAPTPIALENTDATAPSTAIAFASGTAIAYQ